MLKQHKSTGLKYLCYHFGTHENAFIYKGSGSYWTNHLRKHGKDITTIILLETENKDQATECGLKYSELWDVVNSKDFANLTVECCQTTAEPLKRPEVVLRRIKSFKRRIKEDGLTEREKSSRKKGVVAMQSADSREKAAKSLLSTWSNPEKNQKLRDSLKLSHERRGSGEYTEKELEAHKKCSERQKGKTMKERLGEGYIDPRKGRKTNKPAWNTGKKMSEIRGDGYIDPRAKPFTVTSSLGDIVYKGEADFISKTNFSSPQLSKLKISGKYTIKRQKNTRHPYTHGETIFIKYINAT